MPDYRLYFLDPQGHIQGAQDLCAGDDAAAIGLAEDRPEAGPFEMWSGPRKVWRSSQQTAEAGHG